jgi:hypothetical protein
MMSDPIAKAARAAAQCLAIDHGPRLPADVGAELQTRNSAARRPGQFIDPVSVASPIVAIATLAWIIYADLREKTAAPSREAAARRVRVELRERDEVGHPEASRITEIVVTEIIKAADDQ